MYNNFVFDLYGTLVDIRTNEDKSYLWKKMSEFYTLYGAHYTPAEMKAAFHSCVLEEEKELFEKMRYRIGIESICDVEIQIENVFRRMFTEKGVQIGMNLSIHAGQMFRVLSMKYEKLYGGVIELLEKLKADGKEIYLLSNAQRIFTGYEINALGIAKYFDGIIISSDEGCKKPSQKLYEILLDRYELDKEETIMIGNDQYADVQGAKKAGLSALYIHTDISPEYIEEECPADYKVLDGDFKKIGDILGIM